MRENLKNSEALKRPAPTPGFKIRPGLIGGLLLVGAGAYYYFNYVQKPSPPPLIQPTT